MTPQFKDLKRHLARIATTRQYVEVSSFNRPRFIDMDEYRFQGQPFKRLRIILRSNGCSIPTCTMCALPNQGIDPHLQLLTSENYIKQIEYALSITSRSDIICIYNDGSFFSARELPRDARNAIYSMIAKRGCSFLMVESLPNFITRACIEEAKTILGKTEIIVAMGLQSSSDIVRELCINSPVTAEAFRSALNILKDYNTKTKVYILFKPPFLTETEALIDATTSAMWVLNQGVNDVTLCPVRVSPGTIVYHLFTKRMYNPPTLTSVIKCLKLIREKGAVIRVAIFNLLSSDFEAITPSACECCLPKMINGLRQYNLDPWSVNLDELYCNHFPPQEDINNPEECGEVPIAARINSYIQKITNNEISK